MYVRLLVDNSRLSVSRVRRRSGAVIPSVSNYVRNPLHSLLYYGGAISAGN